MRGSSEIHSIESLYNALNKQDEIKAKALLMLVLRSWLTEITRFDPVSGDALHTGIVDFMNAVVKSIQAESSSGERKDRIYRIVSHTKEAVLAIMEHMRDKILREHAMLPIHAVREVDSNSVQWLSRQPGRTLREKLSGKPYMKAVRRRSSVDTAENRLLRAFLFRLEQILIERQNVLSVATEKTCEELLVSIQRWIRGEYAAEIGAWGNLPPNNTLLQNRRYRKVWDSWLWLQTIDEKIIEDKKRIHQDILSVIYWNTLSLLNHSGRFRTVQQPLAIDYDTFSIAPELPVRGYLFPASAPKSKRRLIESDNSSGFITSDDIPLATGIIRVDFNLTGDKFELQVGEDNYLLQIVSGNLVIERAQGEKQKVKIEPANLKEIPKTILSLVTDSSFEYSRIENDQINIKPIDRSVIDLCSIRPEYINHAGSQSYLPFRLLQQIWTLQTDDSKLVVDCGRTKAIALRPDVETISMRGIFSHSGTLADATKSSASMFFTKKISDHIKTDRLTYLVPDWGNDFDLEGIRKSVNFYFAESTPLPKSIAAIFAWQSSKRFVQDRVQEDDFVLVIDSFDGGISITPVQAIYQQELGEILPETQGISWERHPTTIVQNRSIHTAMAHKLNCNGCQTSEELLHLFGFDGLASDAGAVSFAKDDHWYHLPASIRDDLTQDLGLDILSNDDISGCLNSTNRDCRGIGVFILPLEDTIRKPGDLHRNYSWVSGTISPVLGGSILNRWQEKVDDIALWRDHLPELSINVPSDKGYNVNFYLVKDATVTPQRGRTVNIPVEELFTLPAGKTHYSFPLQQGEGNKELQFVAYLRSPAFPLNKATTCKLKMTYTYGADEPYELKFIPLDSAEAGFTSIRVEWRPASEDAAADLENLPVPDFPTRKSWSDFQKFPKKDDKGFSDLLDWVESEMERVADIADFLVRKSWSDFQKFPKKDYKDFSDLLDLDESKMERVVDVADFLPGKIDKRIYDDDVVDYWSWKEDRNGEWFCHLKYDFGVVFFHEKNFEQFDPDANEISFDLEEQRDREGYIARNITLGKSISKRAVDHFRKSLRFPALTIWNHGHSLSEADVPHHFRNAISEGTKKILSTIELENIPDTLKEELFFFLCCLHKDAPGIVDSRLLRAVKDKKLLRRYHRNIAFAIGNVELPWQQELLENVIDPIDNEGLTRSVTMEVLSIALWRSKTLINKLTKDKLRVLSRNLYGCLELDLQKVVDNGKKYHRNTLCKHLELLLALLRSREIEDKDIKMIFSPDNDLTKKYVALINDVSKIVIDNDIELEPRVSLQIEKQEMFRNTPDLLYALRMYLTGESGANTIVITGVSDED